VPEYGLMGALWAHVASRLIVLVLLVLGVRQLLRVSLPWRELLRLLLAALLAAAPALTIALLWPDPWSRFGAGVLYALLYIALSLLLRGFQSDDIETLQEALQRKPRLQARLGPLLHALAARLRRPG
jgi:peptidoglycan biosynthesis protein MviN/MurJ (putative lipid II flippase)